MQRARSRQALLALSQAIVVEVVTVAHESVFFHAHMKEQAGGMIIKDGDLKKLRGNHMLSLGNAKVYENHGALIGDTTGRRGRTGMRGQRRKR